METQVKFFESDRDDKLQTWLKSTSSEEPQDSFYAGVDATKPWFPEALSPWFYLDSYSKLAPEVQLRYNQLYAVATNEIFAVFEVDFICRILKNISTTSNLSPTLLEVLHKVDVEEAKHSRVFHQLNRAAAPEYYNHKNSGKYFAARADGFGIALLNLIATFPSLFGVWVWIAMIFEERSILYSKYYQNSSDDRIDSKFKYVHRLHLIDEVNHVKLDEALVEAFYLKLPTWKRYLTRFFLKRVLNSFRSPRRMSMAIANTLKSEFPHEAKKINSCVGELPQLRKNPDFQNLLFGSSAFKRTRKLIKSCPELADLVD